MILFNSNIIIKMYQDLEDGMILILEITMKIISIMIFKKIIMGIKMCHKQHNLS